LGGRLRSGVSEPSRGRACDGRAPLAAGCTTGRRSPSGRAGCSGATGWAERRAGPRRSSRHRCGRRRRCGRFLSALSSRKRRVGHQHLGMAEVLISGAGMRFRQRNSSAMKSRGEFNRGRCRGRRRWSSRMSCRGDSIATDKHTYQISLVGFSTSESAIFGKCACCRGDSITTDTNAVRSRHRCIPSDAVITDIVITDIWSSLM
jgi:hypothetical protein